ncbi:MAG: cardiolipin synthase [Clostridia bacterium]|nr:cardiolipin synthase [Clostridia bacterium]
MKVLKPAVNRFLAISIALLIQVAVLIGVSKFFEARSAEINALIRILSIAVVLFIINERCNPSIKMAWIVFIYVTPVFGSILYILIGGKSPRKRLRNACEGAEKRNCVYRIPQREAAEKLKAEDECLYVQSKYLAALDFPVCENTDASYYSSGEEAFPYMLEAIEKAEKFIFLEYFIIDEGEMLSRLTDALVKKAKEGVLVRFIYDDMGSVFTAPKGFKERLEENGIKCLAFNPYLPVISAAMNNRDHRKILSIDSRVAFTGGINIADEYINKKEKYGYWKDTVVRIEGDGAREFTLMFLDLWNAFCDKDEDISPFLEKREYTAKDKGFVQPFSDTPLDDETVGENVYLSAINNAKKYIYIYTPYLIPDYELNSALCIAAKKGIDVKIIVPGIPDKKIVYSMTKSYYRTLINAGVEIYKFPSGFVHAKGFVCDDIISCAGTINLDFRSMCHHFECGCVFYNSPVIKEMKLDMIKTIEKCEKVVDFQRFNGFMGSVYHAVLRLIAPLM